MRVDNKHTVEIGIVILFFKNDTAVCYCFDTTHAIRNTERDCEWKRLGEIIQVQNTEYVSLFSGKMYLKYIHVTDTD